MGRIPTTAFPYALDSFFDAIKASPNLLNEYDAKTTGASTTAVDMTVYETRFTSSGAGTTQQATLGNGTGAIIGQRKLLKLAVRTHASDKVALDEENIVNSSSAALSAVEFDAANEFLLVEWTGAKWKEIYSSCTMTPQ